MLVYFDAQATAFNLPVCRINATMHTRAEGLAEDKAVLGAILLGPTTKLGSAIHESPAFINVASLCGRSLAFTSQRPRAPHRPTGPGQIAYAMSRNLNTIKTRLRRALEYLRVLVERTYAK